MKVGKETLDSSCNSIEHTICVHHGMAMRNPFARLGKDDEMGNTDPLYSLMGTLGLGRTFRMISPWRHFSTSV